MKFFKENCLNSSFIHECSLEILMGININKTAVELCINESFVGNDENLDDNLILKENHDKFKNEGIQIWPSIFINNAIYKVFYAVYQ